LRSSRGGGQAILGLIAIVCTVIAIYFIAKHTRTTDEASAAGVFYYCTNCEKEFAAPDQDAPIKCPHCGQITGVYLRKCKCKQCGTVFRAYLLKYDVDVKQRRERRKRGEDVPYGEDESPLVSEPDNDYWVSSASPEGLDVLGNIACPECGATEFDPLFPEKQGTK
jgi:DNA-directed RNA polymerase subunit RPC12/RpoP